MPRLLFADSGFDQSSFAVPPALTIVLLRNQLLGPWSLERRPIPTLDESYSKISYTSYKLFIAVSHNLWVPTKYNDKKNWVNFLFKFECKKVDNAVIAVLYFSINDTLSFYAQTR